MRRLSASHPSGERGFVVLSVRLRSTALVLAALATACSAGKAEKSPSEPVTINVPPPGKEARDLRVPLDAYDLSPTEWETVGAAEDILTGKCMRSQGMKWKQLPRVAETDLEPAQRRRYGVIEPGIARVFGYHLPADRPTLAKRIAAEDSRRENLSRKERYAAYGEDLKGGCLAKARRQLTNGLPATDRDLLSALIGKTFEESQRDPDVLRVFRAWSTCMNRAGARYSSPLKAIEDERWTKIKEPSRQELRIAGADVRCKAKTNLVSVWSEVEERIQKDAIREYPKELKSLKESRLGEVKAARRALEA
ncbi:hypothetical protein ITI46_17590 [Streptomyces oryzae]|uniref:Lipoprotein n=1 Tax=Streptomyces oryzae TaxID=1434886 RepID=A0ABS3XDJ1_9ACTN|nr:hypothetical protein [Streptomyces oryzae]MBO8193457.1 hypothetical protein [Streptomyces oryzae]